MSAADKTSPAQFPQYHQLTMFETARDLRSGGVGKFLSGDKLDFETEEINEEGTDYVRATETDDEAWERKADEADEMGLTAHISEHGGVERPVDLNVGVSDWGGSEERGTVMNGHHRIAGQYDVDPDALMPVHWTDRLMAGSEPGYYFGGGPRAKTGPKWSREDEANIGYEKRF